MGLVKDTIPNLIGGVSEAPDKLLFPNQVKELINYIPSVYSGLIRRPPTEHIKKLSEKLSTHPYIHTINKEQEKYAVFFTGSDLKVFDLKGNQKTVNFENNAVKKYITTQNPLNDLYAATIGDYTFILNKTIKTKLADDLYPNNYANTALIFVKQGDYATDYKIYVNGNLIVSYSSSETEGNTTKTNHIASELYNGLKTVLGVTDWEFNYSGSVIYIAKKDNSAFTIKTEDSNGDFNLHAFYGKADALNLLPITAPNGFIIKITGDEGSAADDYYVKFVTNDGSNFGIGSWVECPAPNIQYKFDISTMPHALIRQSDGTFLFKTINWTERKAGDEISIPIPSFVGNEIQEIFTYKGRLGFLSGDRVILTDVSDIFSTFKHSALTELDTDPLDIASNSKMVDFKHSLPFNEELILFSTSSAFTIKGGDSFTNRTVSCNLTFEYPCSYKAKPIGVGACGLFTYENGSHTNVREIYVTSTYNLDARCITDQIPTYIPKDVYSVIGSVINNMVCYLSMQKRNTIYVYNYFYSDEKKAQSAWSKWAFNGKILGAAFDENYLYLYIQYDGGLFLERINLASKQSEANLNYLLYLDRKVYLTENDLIIDEENNTTSFILPYSDTDNLKIVQTDGFNINYTINEGTITVNGIYDNLICGFSYTSNVKLACLFHRQKDGKGGYKVTEGLLMLKEITLHYSETGYFKVRVTPKYTTQMASIFEFTGVIAGTGSSQVDTLSVSDGSFIVPVCSKNDEVTIEIINDDYTPSNFLSLDWIGDLVIRGQ